MMGEVSGTARLRILKAAAHLFYLRGVRAVGVDDIAARAQVTKKTLYYHFSSKDELIAAYLAERDEPNLRAFSAWFRSAEGTLPDKFAAFFTKIAAAGRHPKWKGCGFQRTVAELADLPGHPARVRAAQHKKSVERWLFHELAAAGAPMPDSLARQIAILLEGTFAAMLVHRDAGYAQSAGAAAKTLVAAALEVREASGEPQ